jgi:hypothetical protein
MSVATDTVGPMAHIRFEMTFRDIGSRRGTARIAEVATHYGLRSTIERDDRGGFAVAVNGTVTTAKTAAIAMLALDRAKHGRDLNPLDNLLVSVDHNYENALEKFFPEPAPEPDPESKLAKFVESMVPAPEGMTEEDTE